MKSENKMKLRGEINNSSKAVSKGSTKLNLEEVNSLGRADKNQSEDSHKYNSTTHFEIFNCFDYLGSTKSDF